MKIQIVYLTINLVKKKAMICRGQMIYQKTYDQNKENIEIQKLKNQIENNINHQEEQTSQKEKYIKQLESKSWDCKIKLTHIKTYKRNK